MSEKNPEEDHFERDQDRKGWEGHNTLKNKRTTKLSQTNPTQSSSSPLSLDLVVSLVRAEVDKRPNYFHVRLMPSRASWSPSRPAIKSLPYFQGQEDGHAYGQEHRQGQGQGQGQRRHSVGQEMMQQEQEQEQRQHLRASLPPNQLLPHPHSRESHTATGKQQIAGSRYEKLEMKLDAEQWPSVCLDDLDNLRARGSNTHSGAERSHSSSTHSSPEPQSREFYSSCPPGDPQAQYQSKNIVEGQVVALSDMSNSSNTLLKSNRRQDQQQQQQQEQRQQQQRQQQQQQQQQLQQHQQQQQQQLQQHQQQQQQPQHQQQHQQQQQQQHQHQQQQQRQQQQQQQHHQQQQQQRHQRIISCQALELEKKKSQHQHTHLATHTSKNDANRYFGEAEEDAEDNDMSQNVLSAQDKHRSKEQGIGNDTIASTLNSDRTKNQSSKLARNTVKSSWEPQQYTAHPMYEGAWGDTETLGTGTGTGTGTGNLRGTSWGEGNEYSTQANTTTSREAQLHGTRNINIVDGWNRNIRGSSTLESYSARSSDPNTDGGQHCNDVAIQKAKKHASSDTRIAAVNQIVGQKFQTSQERSPDVPKELSSSAHTLPSAGGHLRGRDKSTYAQRNEEQGQMEDEGANYYRGYEETSSRELNRVIESSVAPDDRMDDIKDNKSSISGYSEISMSRDAARDDAQNDSVSGYNYDNFFDDLMEVATSADLEGYFDPKSS